MADTTTMTYQDWRGRPVERSIRHTVDIRDLAGTPVYPWLLMSANPHLSAFDVHLFLGLEADKYPAVRRPLKWIEKRRWMTRAAAGSAGPKVNRDGKDAQAFQLLRDNANLSLRDLVKVLRRHGVSRGREWVRKWRGVR